MDTPIKTIIAWARDGRAIYFAGPDLLPESGEKARLTENTDGTYTLTRPDDIKETYDSYGRLLAVTDLNGNTQTLFYEDGQLISVTDPFGRTLSFDYNGAGQLEYLSDSSGHTIQYQYDTENNLIGVIYPDGSSKTYHYEDTDIHNLTGITNEKGIRYATYAYDSQDRATLSTHADDADRTTVSYGYHTSTVSDGEGNSTTIDWLTKEGVGLADQISGSGYMGCGGSTTKSFTYDDNLNVESETDGNGVTTTHTYDEYGNILTRTEAAGTDEEQTTSYTYSEGLHKPTTITNESLTPGQNKVTTFTYDANGNLIQKTVTGYSGGMPINQTTTYQYNTNGQLIQEDGPRQDISDVTTYTYDSMGNITSITRGGALTTTYSNYNSYGMPGRVVDPNGAATEMTYDLRNRLLTSTISGGTTHYAYDPAGNLTQVELPNGNRMYYAYDNANRLIEISDDLENRITYTYDRAGNRTEEHAYDSQGTLRKCLGFQYDNYNRLEKIIYQGSVYKEYDYDGNSNRINFTDANGNSIAYTYDGFNRLKQVIQPGSAMTQYVYDGHGNLIQITDAEGSVTLYTYDDLGRLTETVSPDTGTTSYTYDEAGNLISKTDANDNSITYTYDALNRLTAIYYPDSSQDVYFSYDQGANGKGRLTGMNDPGGTTTYAYDAKGNLIQEVRNIGGINYTMQYSYDAGNKLIGIIYPSGRSVDFTRDSSGRVEMVSTTKDGSTRTLAEDISYLPFGPLKSFSYGNGISFSRMFDQLYRLESIIAGDIENLSYTLDPTGNITAIADNLDPAKSQTFVYDNLNRLTSAMCVFGTLSYTYDKVGNRLTRTMNGQSDAYHYYVDGTTQTNIIDSITGDNAQVFSHDKNGNITGIGSMSLEYSPQTNRLTQVVGSATYTYNANGQRVKKVAGGITTIYHYDINGNLIGETSNNSTQKDYIYLGSHRLAMAVDYAGDFDHDGDVDGSDLAIFAADFGRTNCATAPPCEGDFDRDDDVDGSDLAVFAASFGRTDAGYYYYHNDHLGTPLKLSDQNGAIVWAADYKPFGNAAITIAAITNNFRFPGQYWDGETGLHYNWHRYYDPQTGRYLRADPSQSIQAKGTGIPYLLPFLFNTPLELNLYHYVINNPANGTDPLGLLSCNGTWRQMGSDRIAMWYCLCYWLCVPCDSPVIWSGDYRNLPSTKGQYIYQGGDPERGDRCFCKKPGPEKKCDECKRERVPHAEDWWEGGKW